MGTLKLVPSTSDSKQGTMELKILCVSFAIMAAVFSQNAAAQDDIVVPESSGSEQLLATNVAIDYKAQVASLTKQVSADKQSLAAKRKAAKDADTALENAEKALAASAPFKARDAAKHKLADANEALAHAKVAVAKSIGDLKIAQMNLDVQEKKCAAAQKAASETTADLNNAQHMFDNMRCDTDTGGTCRIGNCYASRGNTKCVSGRCLCASNRECAKQGKCVRFTAKDNAENALNDMKTKAALASKKAQTCK